MFSRCRSLKAVYMEDGWNINLSLTGLSDAVQIGPPPETVVGGIRVWELRMLREISIPDGIERIGRYWFYGSLAEEVTIPW